MTASTRAGAAAPGQGVTDAGVWPWDDVDRRRTWDLRCGGGPVGEEEAGLAGDGEVKGGHNRVGMANRAVSDRKMVLCRTYQSARITLFKFSFWVPGILAIIFVLLAVWHPFFPPSASIPIIPFLLALLTPHHPTPATAPCGHDSQHPRRRSSARPGRYRCGRLALGMM